MNKQTFLNSFVSKDLALAVISQVGGWKEFKEIAPDVVSYGADSGFYGFTYYADTVKFAKKNLTEIMRLAGEMANDFGYDSSFSMIAGFNCLKIKPEEATEAIYNRNSENHEIVLNALAWFVLEEVCRAHDDMKND